MTQGLRIGQELTPQGLADLTTHATYDRAYMNAINLLARRQRSVWEMETYLKRKGYDHNTINKILDELSKRELLDDKKFAEAWVSTRRLLKSVSKRRLVQELQQKKISADIISATLAADEADESAVLRDLIQKKRSQSRYQDNDKLIPYLLRQGFNYDDVRSAIAASTSGLDIDTPSNFA